VPAAEDVGLDQLHHDDLLRFHGHRSFNGRVPPRAVADVAVPQPAGVGGSGEWRNERRQSARPTSASRLPHRSRAIRFCTP
jgi:hypothetical protein